MAVEHSVAVLGRLPAALVTDDWTAYDVDEIDQWWRDEAEERTRSARARHGTRRVYRCPKPYSVWANQDAMKNAAVQAQARRDEGRALGVNFDEDNYREIVFADVR